MFPFDVYIYYRPAATLLSTGYNMGYLQSRGDNNDPIFGYYIKKYCIAVTVFEVSTG